MQDAFVFAVRLVQLLHQVQLLRQVHLLCLPGRKCSLMLLGLNTPTGLTDCMHLGRLGGNVPRIRAHTHTHTHTHTYTHTRIHTHALQSRIDVLVAEQHVRSMHLGQLRGELDAARADAGRCKSRLVEMETSNTQLQVCTTGLCLLVCVCVCVCMWGLGGEDVGNWGQAVKR